MPNTMRVPREPRQGHLLLAVEPTTPRPAPTGSLLDLALGVLRRELHGVIGATAGRRSAAYRMQQLDGRRAVTLDDVAELAAQPTREARAAVHALGLLLVDATRPMGRVDLATAVARLTRESADVPAAYVEGAADGRMERAELLRLRDELDEMLGAAGVVATQVARELAS